MADDQLVVKSDHNWLQTMIVYAGSIVLYCSIIIFYKGKGKVDFESIVLDLILIIVAIMVILWFWWEGGKTIILSKDGCIVKFVNYKKYYAWNELEVCQLRCDFFRYEEGVLFARKSDKFLQNGYSVRKYMTVHPFSSFCVNFKGKYNLAQRTQGYSMKLEVCPIDRELFFEKMKEWGVTIEAVRVMDEAVFYDKLGEICTRRNGYGWKILSFVLVLIICACLMFPILVLKDMGTLFISIPFSIIFLIIYIVITSRKSYRLKMDEKGCIRKFLFLSKRYLWKDLRVKLVASEESHCGEGVLFIKKKSGNSSSASETFSYASLHPYSSFVANFEIFGKMYGEKDALHEINKELFLKKMKEWGVEVEGLPKEE